MAKYIDTDQIVFRIRYVSSDKLSSDIRKIAFSDEIARMPAADVVEVRHGEWIERHGQSYLVSPMKYDEYGPILQDYVYYECSECGRTENKKEPYCHCGAKMDGKKERKKNMKEFIYWANCDFCGQEKMTIGTTHGIYCEDCLRLMIEEYEEKIEHLEGVENEA